MFFIERGKEKLPSVFVERARWLRLRLGDSVRICRSIAVVCGLWLLGAGCVSTPFDHQSKARLVSQSSGDRILAKEANERGLTFVEEGKLDLAEAAFREAIAADPRFAPAHNNLGLVLLGKGEFYDAANAFKTASKIQPNAAEPIANLVRLYKAVGWEKEAAKVKSRTRTLKQLVELDAGQ